MNKIGYYVGIASLALGIGMLDSGCRRAPPSRPRVRTVETIMATGEINEKTAIYYKNSSFTEKEDQEFSHSCRLEIGSDIVITDLYCKGKFGYEDSYTTKDQTYTLKELNQEAVDKINGYLNMGLEGKLPKHVNPEVSPEVKDENSKKVLEGL